MKWTKSVSILDKFLYNFSRNREQVVKRMLVWLCNFSHSGRILVWYLYFFLSSPHHLNVLLNLIQWSQDKGYNYNYQKQRWFLGCFNLHVYISKDLMEQVVLSFHLANLGLNVSAAILPSGRDSPLVLYKWREREIIAENKTITKWSCNGGIQFYINSSKESQHKS